MVCYGTSFRAHSEYFDWRGFRHSHPIRTVFDFSNSHRLHGRFSKHNIVFGNRVGAATGYGRPSGYPGGYTCDWSGSGNIFDHSDCYHIGFDRRSNHLLHDRRNRADDEFHNLFRCIECVELGNNQRDRCFGRIEQ